MSKQRARKPRRHNLFVYIYRVLKQVHCSLGVSRRCMAVLSSFAWDALRRLAAEGEALMARARRRTLTPKRSDADTTSPLSGDH